jgi:hypothetical protein
MTGKFVKGAWVEDEVQSNLNDFTKQHLSSIVCDKDDGIVVSYDESGDLVDCKIIQPSTGNIDNCSEYINKLENLSDKYGSSDKPIGCKENERIAGNYTLFEKLQLKLFGKIIT